MRQPRRDQLRPITQPEAVMSSVRFMAAILARPPPDLRQIGRRLVGDRDRQKPVLHCGFDAGSALVDSVNPY